MDESNKGKKKQPFFSLYSVIFSAFLHQNIMFVLIDRWRDLVDYTTVK
jgi:hypothetical protein